MENEIEEFIGMDHPKMKGKAGLNFAFTVKYPTNEETKKALEDIMWRFAEALGYLKDK